MAAVLSSTASCQLWRLLMIMIMMMMAMMRTRNYMAAGQVQPLACTSSAPPSCPAILYVANGRLPAGPTTTPDDLARFYNASSLLTSFYDGVLLLVDCDCRTLTTPLDTQVYFASTTYVVTTLDSGSGIAQISSERFDNLATNESDGHVPVVGKPLDIHLGCGCPPSTQYKSLITYSVQYGDIVADIANRFQSIVDAIVQFNNLQNSSQIQVGQVIFVPSTIAPSSIHDPNKPLGAPNPVPSKKGHYVSVGFAVGVGILLAIVLAFIIIIGHAISVRRKRRRRQEEGGQDSHGHQKKVASAGFVDVESNCPASKGSSSFWNAFFRRPGSTDKTAKRTVNMPGEAKDVFESEKPVVFTYEEVVQASHNFLDSVKLGEGAFGAVYRGHLHNQEVAIKKMKASKSREFAAELRVLCKVHHSNLVELIGYAVGEEELYLVYEFAEHGSLSDCLQNPVGKGYRPLSWVVRVQIALDVARGLEYIHDHTRAHYVHRDIKTSNILLDEHFRAKVGDFGLAKLVERAGGEGENLTTQVVGTVGYLAPEYIRDGQVTSKSDVYAFGVVLMELITGMEALSRSRNADKAKVSEQRSLVSLLYSLSHNGNVEFEKLQVYVDPNLKDNYPEIGLFQMAELARSCVEEDSLARPDMREVVFKLSRILLLSIEWEASVAGSSQIFSGLVQGR